MEKSFLSRYISSLLVLFIIAISAFFLPVTRDFVVITKSYFFQAFVLVAALIGFISLLLRPKFIVRNNIAIKSFFIILFAYAGSILLVAPNKISALYEPQTGAIVVFSLFVYLFLTSSIIARSSKDTFKTGKILLFTGAFYSAVSIVLFVLSQLRLSVPTYLSFVNNASFNSLGTDLEYLLLTFIILISSGQYVYQHLYTKHQKKTNERLLFMGLFFLIVAGFVMRLVFFANTIISQNAFIILPPWNISWFAFVEILKHPLTGLFGIGTGNFSSLFTQVKPASYNVGKLWQITAFNYSRSGLLQFATETGLIGGFGFCSLLFRTFSLTKKVERSTKMAFILIFLEFILFPASFISLFFLFSIIALVIGESALVQEPEEYELNLEHLLYVRIIAAAVIGFFLISVLYFTTVNYISELYYQQSQYAALNNNVQQMYDLQVKAIKTNPQNALFRRGFSQTNIAVVRNIIQQDKEQLTKDETNALTQAAQAAIDEAKVAVALNQRNVTNWLNLARVYNQIVPISQEARGWAEAAYQQAILLDQRNPTIRFDLGSFYYSLNNYEGAQTLFEQSVSLKPDWANGRYNLAWSYYMNGKYQDAVTQMQIVTKILDPTKNQSDFKKAQEDLDTFSKKMDEESTQSSDAINSGDGVITESQLTLPSPQPQETTEGIELPVEASPEAR
ncbi:hypothetical protein KC726_02495 [Candidatus Woesebacteria bacterium]|nr:hypothetical protein [Candidatus Woesebacteria bacterium]